MELIETPYLLGEKNKHIQKALNFNKTQVVNMQLQKGEKIAEHDSMADVLIIVRSGKVSFVVEGQTVEAAPDNILHMNPKEKHSLTAIEPSDLLVLQITP
ncbi:quercetin dioxygenase-like cupin family protein [Planomicrobium stackebrandtii]|uniref:Quercetin dioxygenase-like cupin family protein n=1 Tax=Planomicrobium stackebrandtii TaxID=253160 RepID=A0ABU0GRK2_9BACL|nr:AraC family ligand binding domain-containing protein [Planomicrobium stackebrandtii]MDQ0427984.1 quercetin dioxygenase-like cupin family protein [Planomicrobium stackebrandtii]